MLDQIFGPIYFGEPDPEMSDLQRKWYACHSRYLSQGTKCKSCF